DADGDGDPDLFLGSPGSLLWNDHGRFEESRQAVLGVTGCSSAHWADFDGDRDLDLLLFAGARSTLLQNAGDNRFIDATPALDAQLRRLRLASAFDIDRDGFIDIFGPEATTSEPRLLHNAGGKGFFAAPLRLQWGRGHVRAASWADVDGDGDL